MSRSQTRERCATVQVRLSPTERAKVEAAATARGLSLSAYGRSLMLGAVTPGSVGPKKKGPDVLALGRLLAPLAKVGSNMNQIARLGNQGQGVDGAALAVCIEEHRALVAEITKALHDS